jgi:hypothetical protein
MAIGKRVFSIRVTAFSPHVDHAVTDDEMAARSDECRGEYRAVCGAIFLPAPDVWAPGRFCPGCVRVLRARATLPTIEQRLDQRQGRHARPGVWKRLRAGVFAGG